MGEEDNWFGTGTYDVETWEDVKVSYSKEKIEELYEEYLNNQAKDIQKQENIVLLEFSYTDDIICISFTTEDGTFNLAKKDYLHLVLDETIQVRNVQNPEKQLQTKCLFVKINKSVLDIPYGEGKEMTKELGRDIWDSLMDLGFVCEEELEDD